MTPDGEKAREKLSRMAHLRCSDGLRRQGVADLRAPRRRNACHSDAAAVGRNHHADIRSNDRAACRASKNTGQPLCAGGLRWRRPGCVGTGFPVKGSHVCMPLKRHTSTHCRPAWVGDTGNGGQPNAACCLRFYRLAQSAGWLRRAGLRGQLRAARRAPCGRRRRRARGCR